MCENCGRNWISRNAKPNSYQICSECETEVLPIDLVNKEIFINEIVLYSLV